MPKLHNWNAYKLFKNGKRAKIPICKVMAANVIEAEKNFFNEILPNMSDNLSKYNWAFIREDVPQEKITDKEIMKFSIARQRREKFFANIAAKIDKLPDRAAMVLLKSADTDWKWEWAACQPATLKHYASLSPQFDKESDAIKWLDRQLENDT